MPDIPTIPKLWGDLRLDQLHITGASFEKRETSTGPIMVPTHITFGHKGRRWSLDVTNAYETDRRGKRITPAISEAEAGIKALFPEAPSS